MAIKPPLSKRLRDDPGALAAVRAAALRIVVEGELPTTRTLEEWERYDYQIRPPGVWETWVLRGGRGSGKTRAGAEEVRAHIQRHNGKKYEFKDDEGNIHRGTHRCRIGVGGPTISDVRDVCFEGESGLLNVLEGMFVPSRYNRTLLEIRTRDGAYIKGMGSENPGRWNGPQWCYIWWDELALSNQAAWDQAQFGLRLYEDPRCMATTTPKRRKWLRDFEAEPGVVVTVGKTVENKYLAPAVAARLQRRYGGRSIGKQELEGEYAFAVEGAMWDESWIEDYRVLAPPDLMSRIVVAVDPSVSEALKLSEERQAERENQPHGGRAATGICVMGRSMGPTREAEAYVLHSESNFGGPADWADRALELHDLYEADCIVGEVNNGGALVEAVIRSRLQPGQMFRFKSVSASRGKQIRAEPAASLYSQGKIHHVGVHEGLEEQQLTFPVSIELLDELDACVWAITELMSGGYAEEWDKIPTQGARMVKGNTPTHNTGYHPEDHKQRTNGSHAGAARTKTF